MRSDGNATSLSNTAAAVARFGDRRVAEHLAVLVDPNDPPLGRDRVHDPHPVFVEQRVELPAERAEPSGLHLDQLTVGTDEVDHESTHRHLDAVARLGQQRLHRGVERTLTHNPDGRHEDTGYVQLNDTLARASQPDRSEGPGLERRQLFGLRPNNCKFGSGSADVALLDLPQRARVEQHLAQPVTEPALALLG